MKIPAKFRDGNGAYELLYKQKVCTLHDSLHYSNCFHECSVLFIEISEEQKKLNFYKVIIFSMNIRVLVILRKNKWL